MEKAVHWCLVSNSSFEQLMKEICPARNLPTANPLPPRTNPGPPPQVTADFGTCMCCRKRPAECAECTLNSVNVISNVVCKVSRTVVVITRDLSHDKLAVPFDAVQVCAEFATPPQEQVVDMVTRGLCGVMSLLAVARLQHRTLISAFVTHWLLTTAVNSS